MTSANPTTAVEALLAALPDRALVARGHALARAIAVFTRVDPEAAIGDSAPLTSAARLLPAAEAGALDAKALAALGEVAALIAAVVRLPRPRAAVAGEDERGGYPAEGLRRMLLAMVDDPRVVVLRLAQELTALRALRAEQPGSSAERAAAQVVRDVYAPLANRLGLGVFKWELEDLAFRALEPQAYDEIAAALARTRQAREAEVAAAVTDLHQRLAAAGIEAEVAGRPKHIHSIHRKMVKKGVPLEQVFDVRALRVLVSSVERCYAALGVVHATWPPVPGEFDDYVARPKGNGYRSLHTAVMASDGHPLEVQIRTPEMHESSELGVAAHWRYKGATVRTDGANRAAAAPAHAPANAKSDGLDARLEWLRGLLESSGDERDFVARFRTELFEDRIYVLTPQGAVIDLPAGATPLDFAYHVHTELGHRCRGAKVDGRMVPLTYQLSNAQQVEVVAAKHGEPSRDWLNAERGFLASGRARDKVKAWFRAQDHEVNAKAGREIVDRELARLGARDLGYDALVEATGAGTVDGLMAKVGAGDVSVAQIAGVAHRELKLHAPQVHPSAKLGAALANEALAKSTAITIGGVSDLLHQLAKCCRPLPPEPVVGYLTRGRGVTVHRKDCGYLARAAARSALDGPVRTIEVEWGATEGERFRVGIEVRASDRIGLLKDLTAALADGGVDIAAVQSEAREGEARLTLIVQVGDLGQLSRALARLERLPGVDHARRSAG